MTDDARPLPDRDHHDGAAHAPEASADARRVATLQDLLGIEATALAPALAEASQLINSAFGADKTDVFLHEAASDTLVALGTSRTPMGTLQRAHGLDRLAVANGGRQVEVYTSGVPYLTGHADHDPQVLPGITRALGVRSMVAAAIHVGSTRRGILVLCSAAPEFFSADDLRQLEAVARWVGMVVHRAELVEQIREHAAEQGRRLAADEVIRVLAHDLHNLLTPLKGNVDLLVRRGATMASDRVLQHASSARAAVDRLRRFVDDLLDADRLERGVFTLSPQVVDLTDLVRETVRTYGTEGAQIRVDTPEDVSVSADPDRLRQAIENLLGNALKHSPPETPVHVMTSIEENGEGSWACVTVADRGTGIPAELLPRLFTRFAAGPGSSGLGLGLYIARRIATAHGGELTAESAPGEGSRFRLRLPAAVPPA